VLYLPMGLVIWEGLEGWKGRNGGKVGSWTTLQALTGKCM